MVKFYKLNSSVQKISLPSIIVGALIITCSCSVNKSSSPQSFILSDEYVFVEYISSQDGEVLSGKAPRGMRIDGPSYRFDKETKQLQVRRNDNLKVDSIKILLGSGKVLTGAAGSGVSTHLTNIKGLPFTENKLTINRIDKNGACFLFQKQEINLKEGEEWKISTSRIDTVKTDQIAVIKTNTTYTIRYFGKFKKASISGIN